MGFISVEVGRGRNTLYPSVKVAVTMHGYTPVKMHFQFVLALWESLLTCGMSEK